jgi:hypothetical protein
MVEGSNPFVRFMKDNEIADNIKQIKDELRIITALVVLSMLTVGSGLVLLLIDFLFVK